MTRRKPESPGLSPVALKRFRAGVSLEELERLAHKTALIIGIVEQTGRAASELEVQALQSSINRLRDVAQKSKSG